MAGIPNITNVAAICNNFDVVGDTDAADPPSSSPITNILMKDSPIILSKSPNCSGAERILAFSVIN